MGDAYLLRQDLDLRDDEAQSKESRLQIRGDPRLIEVADELRDCVQSRVQGRRISTAHSLTKIEPKVGIGSPF